MHRFATPVFSLVSAALVIAVLVFATPASSAPDNPFTGCYVGQGWDEWAPGVANTTLPNSAPAGKAYKMSGRRLISIVNPSGSAGDCYVGMDTLNVATNGSRGFPLKKGDPQLVVEISSSSPVKVACTAQLVSPNALQVFQCK
jgi:hypothetical protein